VPQRHHRLFVVLGAVVDPAAEPPGSTAGCRSARTAAPSPRTGCRRTPARSPRSRSRPAAAGVGQRGGQGRSLRALRPAQRPGLPDVEEFGHDPPAPATSPPRKHVAGPAGRHLASWPALICILTSHGRPLTSTGSASRRSPGWPGTPPRQTGVVHCRELRPVITTQRRDHGRALRRRLASCAGPGAAEDVHEPALHRAP
jgi:hypothetical protein